MSDIKYGLISETDARVLEKTIDLLCDEFEVELNITEIGLYNGRTSAGIYEYVTEKNFWDDGYDCFNYRCNYTGIDNNKDGEKLIFFPKEAKLIIGNSNEVYNQIPNESQHLILVDALHTFAGVVSDYFCYAPKVKIGGYLAFHDTGKHLDPLSGWQGVGDENDSDMCLGGVRKALKEIGLFDEFLDGTPKFELVFDEADINDEGGGICVFKKLY